MKIYLIRHGETTGDLEDRFGGDYDDHLTEKGQEQAEELGNTLKDKQLDIILHSPRIRAVETANVVSEVTGVVTKEIHDFRERNNYGVLTGLTKKEGAAQFPQEWAKIEKDKTFHDVTNSESYEELKKRVVEAFEKVSERSEKTVAIVTHGGVIGGIAREVFGHENIKIGDCGIIEIDFTDNKHTIVCLTGASIPS